MEIAGEKHQIRPTHWRYLRAKIDCVDAGKPLTGVNQAKFAGVSRIALWKLQRRYPWLEEWCAQILRSRNAHRWGSIELRMAVLAEQGSVSAADQFCKMVSGHYTKGLRRDENEETDAPDAENNECVINILVPHPDLPNGGRLPQLPGPSSMSVVPPLEDIPGFR